MKTAWRKFAPIGLYIAIVAAVASLGIYIVRREFDLYLQISLVIFVLGIAFFILLDPDRVRIALTGRQARYGSNTLLLTVAVLGILVVVNYFVFKNTQRWDLTEDKINTLSKETLDTLDTLPENVEVQAFFTPERSEDYARSMLENYAFNADSKLTYEFINPLTDPVSAQAAEITRDGSIVFWMGDQKEIVTTVTEQEFTSALVKLISGEEKAIYFLTGHGELSIDESGDEGFSQAKALLEQKNYVIKELNLLSADGVPQDASAVVIVGAVYPLEISEVAMLSDYMAAGGAMIIMQDSPIFTKFGDQKDYLAGYLRDSWGIILGEDIIVDQASYLGSMAPVGTVGTENPITQKIQGLATGFPTARSVQVDGSNTDVSATILIQTANNQSWAETDLAVVIEGGDISYNEGSDLLGPVPMVVSAENDTSGSKIVVFGDNNFAMNGNFTFFGNGDLFIGSVDWVVGQDELINLTPKNSTQRFILSPQPYLMNMIFLFVVVLMPGTVLVAGIISWIRRRQRG